MGWSNRDQLLPYLERIQKHLITPGQSAVLQAETASALLQAVQSEYGTYQKSSRPDDNVQTAEAPSDGSDIEAGVRLHTRSVVVAKENIGRLGGMVHLSLDQFENESRRMAPLYIGLSQPIKFTRQRSSQGL